ncbi:hypothetical protein [Psychroserpens sp. NJDZ02]|uniref:hypothetical protein n=1 Tax=Psychroserpens sp. NJDZ02 TaxID=2570561 RepID=UPI0010A8D247|nr:hypothetical protein [Psychroserpens sp. NJDZ02]QCE42630.1 hypothetical protein E9099_14855 [Psychroserpens sp. NJDZ02]
MRKISVLLISIFSLLSCDDGDIITTELEFDDTFEACGDLVFFKAKTDPNETLSLQLDSPSFTVASLVETAVNADNALFVDLVTTEVTVASVAGLFTFRSYTSDPSDFFCNDVPPNGIQITEEYTSTSGTAYFTVSLLEDDNDGIPAELEDLNGNGDLYDDDTDGDGLPNFLDADDDGDNVLTASEGVAYTETDGLSNALDTDGDGIPNYLDNDDDGDGVPTRNEEITSFDNNPTNDVSDSTTGPDYLNPLFMNNNPPTSFRSHTISQTFTVTLKFENISFPEIIYDETEFGTLDDTLMSKTRTITPPFI